MKLTEAVAIPGGEVVDAVVIPFPRHRIAEPSLAETTIAELAIVMFEKAASAASNWQRQRILSTVDGMTTALSIVLAGSCGEDQWVAKATITAALESGCSSAEELIRMARSPEDPDVA